MDAKTSSYDTLLAVAATRVTEPVTLSNGGEIAMRGLTVMEFIQTLRQFPKLRDVLLNLIGAGDEPEDEGAAADLMEIFVDQGPEAIATVIAVAAGAKGDAGFRDAILAIGDDDFFALLENTMRLTMPEGVGSFFGKLGRVAKAMGLVAAAERSTQQAA